MSQRMATAHAFTQAVMIGDSLAADVQGAQNAGLAASVWVNQGGQPRPPQARPLAGPCLHVPGSWLAISAKGVYSLLKTIQI